MKNYKIFQTGGKVSDSKRESVFLIVKEEVDAAKWAAGYYKEVDYVAEVSATEFLDSCNHPDDIVAMHGLNDSRKEIFKEIVDKALAILFP